MSKIEQRGWKDRQVVKYLYYFKCKFCATWAVTAEDSGKYVECNGCGGSKKYEHRVPVESQHDEETWAWAKERGVGHLPRPDFTPKACTRCGETFPYTKLRVRMGGRVCVDCYRAEERPPDPLPDMSPENLKRLDAERAEAIRQSQADDDARMDAAYAAVERVSEPQ